jgi:hypothetical protein
MSLRGGTEAIESWTETDDQRLETRLADIAVAIVVHGERGCRAGVHHYREWVIKRKAELVEEQRRKEEERQRLERERLERLEKARVARLLSQARALKEAQEIRAYVAAVRELQPTLDNPLNETELQHWVAWSLSQANRIDPVTIRSGTTRLQTPGWCRPERLIARGTIARSKRNTPPWRPVQQSTGRRSTSQHADGE